MNPTTPRITGPSEMPKRNGWTIAEHAGDRTPDRTQRLLNRASWDTLAAMSEIRRFAAAGLEEAALHAVLAPKDDRFGGVIPPQKVLGKIELCVGKKMGARHAVAVSQATAAFVADHAAKIPNQVPKAAAILDRPGVQFGETGKRPATARFRLTGKGGQRMAGNRLPRWLPQRLFARHRYVPLYRPVLA